MSVVISTFLSATYAILFPFTIKITLIDNSDNLRENVTYDILSFELNLLF